MQSPKCIWYVLYVVYTDGVEGDLPAADVCIYNMPVCGYIGTRGVHPSRPSLSFQQPGKISRPVFFLESFLHLPSLSETPSLCGNWRLVARHRSANLILQRSVHLQLLRSASHLPRDSSSGFVFVSQIQYMGNRFQSSPAKHLKMGSRIGSFLVSQVEPTQWCGDGDPSLLKWETFDVTKSSKSVLYTETLNPRSDRHL